MSNTQRAVEELNRTINNFASEINVKVDAVSHSSDEVQATANKLLDRVQQFKTGMIQSEEKQIAHENLIRIDQTLKEQFGDHDAIRRTIIGVVRDFDINLVRTSTIKELSEQLWITSSRYWLSYALLAITAWVNDDQGIAKSALAECVRREPPKATLFFCLMNLRFGRNQVARSWFQEYLKTVDPSNLGIDAAIMLQAYLSGLFGSDLELEHRVNTVIRSWINELNAEGQAVQAQQLYSKYIETMAVPNAPVWENAKDHCSVYNEMQVAYREANKPSKLLALLDEIDVEVDNESTADFRSRVDKVLNDLVNSYDKEEDELMKERDYFNTIIDFNGRVDEAKASFNEKQKMANNGYNVGERMVQWSVYSRKDEINVRVRKFAMRNTKDWFLNAVEKWFSNANQLAPLDYPITVADWSGISNGEDAEILVRQMEEYYASNKLKICYFNAPNIAALIVLILSLGLVFLTPYSLIFTIAAAGFLLFRILKANKDYPAMIRRNVAALRSTIKDIVEFKVFFKNEMSKHDLLINRIKNI
ncbi:MAG: hypothetical protein E7386_06875 [Ruminococcaceae bacterium]|nr:hypothetical protein [Oscillospiraceae bacterium]